MSARLRKTFALYVADFRTLPLASCRRRTIYRVLRGRQSNCEVKKMTTLNVDSRGTACPGPITDLIRAYRKAAAGDTIVLMADDPVVVPDTRVWCERTKNELVSTVEQEGAFVVTIKVTGKRG